MFVIIILDPASVNAYCFGISTSPLFDNKAPHIENVPYVIIEWFAKLSNARSAPVKRY